MTTDPTNPGTTAAAPIGREIDRRVDPIVAAVLARPQVAGLHGGRGGQVVSYLPGRRITGIRITSGEVAIHVVAGYPAVMEQVAGQVRRAVAPVARGLRVDVAIEDLAVPSESSSDPQRVAPKLLEALRRLARRPRSAPPESQTAGADDDGTEQDAAGDSEPSERRESRESRTDRRSPRRQRRRWVRKGRGAAPPTSPTFHSGRQRQVVRRAPADPDHVPRGVGRARGVARERPRLQENGRMAHIGF